jgi:hypothetical protein
VKVNFDYEYKLFHQGVSPSWGEAMNRQLEFIALLWGDVAELEYIATYDLEYLTHLKDHDLVLPENNTKNTNKYFWGREENYSLELRTNSKKTSFELAQKHKWLLPGEFFTTQAFCVPEGWVAKPVDSVSGRGFQFAKSMSEGLKHGAIISPWVARVADISCLYRNERKFFLLNINDQKGVFRGALVIHTDSLKEYLHEAFQISIDEIIESSDKIVHEYKKLGAQSIQIDSFIYKNSNHKYSYYPLCEVNDRKTMGELAHRLKERLYPHKRAMLMSFGQSFRPGGLCLSPMKSKFKLHVQGLDDSDLKSALRTHQE